MGHFALISFYDNNCKGIRYLSAVLKNQSHAVTRIHFKSGISKEVPNSKSNSKQYYIYYNGSLESSGFEVNKPADNEMMLLQRLVSDIKPDILCVSTRVCFLDLCNDIIKKIKSSNPNLITIAGGYGPTYLPAEFAKIFDYICYGEGEKLIQEVGRAVNSGETDKIRDIDGIGFMSEDGNLILNGAAPPIFDLDQIPYPDLPCESDFHIESDQIKQGLHLEQTSKIEIFASRGCPGSCTYCSTGQWNDIYNKKFSKSPLEVPRVRVRSPSSVIDEIKTTIKKYREILKQPINQVTFLDSIFGFQKKWLIEFCDIYSKEINLLFQANTDVRFHSLEMLEKLYITGLRYTTFSVQSGSEHIREKIFNRKISNKKLIEISRWLHNKEALVYQMDLLAFNPFDTEETLKETFQFLCQIPPTSALTVFRLIIQPNTSLDRLYKETSPKILSNEHHETWIYLWHMAGRGDRERKVAEKIVNNSAGITPIHLHEKLRRVYMGEQDVTFSFGEKKGAIETENLIWPYALNLNRKEIHWQTVSKHYKRQIASPMGAFSHKNSKSIIYCHDFLCIPNKYCTFVYLGFISSQNSTKGQDLRNSLLTVGHHAKQIDLKGGNIHFFIEHSPTDTRWVHNDAIKIENTDFQKILDNEEVNWSKISGIGSLEAILAGNSGDLGYTYFGFMVVGTKEDPVGIWGLTNFSIGPIIKDHKNHLPLLN